MKSPESIVEPKASTARSSDHPATPDTVGIVAAIIGSYFLPESIGELVSYLEHDAQPTIVLDPTYQILAGNTAYQRQFCVAGQPHVGHKCYHVSHHYDVPCDQAVVVPPRLPSTRMAPSR